MDKKKKITVSKFVEGFNRLSTDELKANYVKKHILTTYSPIALKMSILKLMNEKSVVKGDTEYIDLTLSKINLMMGILVLYTDITPDKDDEGNSLSLNAYDLLKSSGAISYVYDAIGEDLEELMSVQATVMDTWYNANCSTEAFIAKQINRFAGLFGGVASIGAEKLADVLEDENKAKKIVAMFEKTLKKVK